MGALIHATQTEAAMQRIVELIRRRHLSPDDRLPSERQLEQEWKLGRTTVNKAVSCLIAQGHLRRVGYKLYPTGLQSSDGQDSAAALAPSPVHVIQPPYGPAISQGLFEAAHDVAQSLKTHTIPVLSNSAAEQVRQLGGLLHKGTAGFVLWPWPDAPVEHLLRQFSAQSVPFVLCDLDLGPFDFVGVDNEQGLRLAVEHLHGLGHRRIIYVTQPLRIPSLRRRGDGYSQRCQSLGLRRAARSVIEIPSYAASDILDAFNRFRTEFADATAAAFSNDVVAIEFMRLAREAGLRVPQDLSIIGFDGIDATGLTVPALTTVTQNFRQSGVVATQLLFHLMDNQAKGHTEPPCRVRVEPRLIVRQSTARRS